jgi:DNA-directed RNA polymerase subunit RPC12/RpoP
MNKKRNRRYCPYCGTEFTKEKNNLLMNASEAQINDEDTNSETAFYTCRDCGKDFALDEIIKDEDIEEKYKVELLPNNCFTVKFPEEFNKFNITEQSVTSVENFPNKNLVQINIGVVYNHKTEFPYPMIKDVCSCFMNLLNKEFNILEIDYVDRCGDICMVESYNNIKFSEIKRSSILKYDNDNFITFGLTFSYDFIDYENKE